MEERTWPTYLRGERGRTVSLGTGGDIGKGKRKNKPCSSLKGSSERTTVDLYISRNDSFVFSKRKNVEKSCWGVMGEMSAMEEEMRWSPELNILTLSCTRSSVGIEKRLKGIRLISPRRNEMRQERKRTPSKRSKFQASCILVLG